MSFTEWSNAKKKKREESSTQPSPSVAVKPTASGKTGSGGSYNSFAEWSDARKKERATQSAQDWADAANALLKDTQSYFGSWRSKDDDGYNSIQERNSALLAQADSWRKQYAGNDEVISYIDSVVEALSNARQGSRGYLDFYSQFDSEDSYKKWMQHSTPEGRQEQYEKNKARLEELQKQQRESRNYQPGVNPYLSGGSATSGSPYAASQQDPKVGQSDIKKEIDQIRKEILLYERGGTDETGFYYGFKVSDDYGKLKANADYGAKSANRDFQNPSREDLIKRDTLNDSSSWYTDADGVYRDAFGNELKTDASGNWVNPNAQGYAVVDRLGLYLSASEEEKQEAVSVPVSMEGTWESVIKDGYDGNWELLDKDEVDIYYYLLNTSGQETADKYLSDMKVELNRRNAQNATVRYTEAFDEANALERLAMSIASTPAQLFSGAAGFIEDTAMTMMGKDINPYSAAHGGMNYSNTIRSEQAKAFDEATGGVAIPFIDFTVGDLYRAGMSAFDMAVGGRLGAGAYEALMGMGAASSEAKRLYEQGASNSQIAWGGALAGAAEMVFEHASIENLINMKDADTVGQMVKNILVQGGIEASEEGFTEIANTITNAIVMGDASDWAKLLVEHDGDYLAALIAKAKEVGNAAFSGFVSGSMGGGAQSTASYAQTQAQNKELGQYISGAGSTDALMALAQEMAGATSGKDQKRLTSQSERIKKDEFLTKGGKQRATGRLYSTVRSVVTEQNISEISSALQEKGFSKKDATAIAGAVAVQASGIELSDKQQKTLQKYESNETVQAVLDEVLGNEESGINQRAKSIAKFEFDTMRSHITSQIKQAVASQENAESDDTVDALEEDGAEGNYEASADGKTILKSNSKIVNIQEVADIRDGKMTLKLDDGSTVDAEDVIYGSEGEALVYETIAQMGASVRAANILVDGFKATQGMDARVYAQGIEEAFRYGKQGIPARKLATSIFASKLNPGQQEYVYRQGKKAAGKQVAKEQATVLKNRTVAENATTAKDSRSYKAVLEDGVSASSLNESQKASYRLADQIAEAAKVNIRVYAGKTGEHGYYDPKTDEIYLNLNATNQSRKSMMAFTLGHELVHRAKKGSPAKYKAFANFLMEQYGKQDSDIEAMIGEELAAAKRFKIQMTYDQAFEEVVCDACERMLLDTDAGQKLAEFGAQSKQNKSFLEDLKRWITEFLDKLRSIFEGVEPNSMAAKEFAKFDASVKQILADMYVDMTIDAGENLSVIQNAFGKGTVVQTNEQGEFTMASSQDGSQKVFNLVTWKNGGRETLEATLLREGYTEDEVKAAITIMDEKQNLVERIANEVDGSGKMAFPEQGRINEATLTTDLKDGHAVLSALVSNGDYPVNIDLLMVCKKRKAYQRVINRLCETGMIQQATVDALAIAEINKILGKYGFETACLGCFVESRRLRIQEWAQTICKEWNAEVKKRDSNAKAFGFGKGEAKLTPEEVMKIIGELESGGEKNDQGNLNLGQGSAVKRMGVLLDKVPSLRKTLSIEDLITPDGLSSLRSFDSNLFSMVKSRYGSNSPKFVQEFNPYNHELAMYGKVPSQYDSLREYLYAIGGARMQSFSDFIVENWFDYCQIVADLAARKLPMHTYTKEISLAKLFGLTGIKINMSLIPDVDRSLSKEYAGLTRNEKGELELIWADKDRFKATKGKSYMQSINFADAVALQNDPRYSANVGTIAVGISDKHIEMMLDDARIRMIIPYHSSGMNPIFADLMGTSYYKDYTNFQNTTVKQIYNSKSQPVSLKLEKAQADKLTSGFQFNEVLQELGDARAAAEAYKEWCADASKHSITIKGETYTAELTPKFDDFSGHENYYKLLEDFNTYDCISEQAAPQGDVQQTYPEDFDNILKAELKAQEGHRQKQEANQAFDKAMGEIEGYLKSHTKADTVHYAQQHGIKLSKKDSKLDAADKAKLKKLQEEGASFMLPKDSSYQEPAYQEWDVQAALYDAMDHADNGEDNLIRVGEMPRYITEKIGIEGDFYIYRNHAYENMVSREQAIKDGRPVTRKGENIHFHDLGVDTMTEAILSLENPTMTIATKTKDGNPAVIMILPVKGKNKAPLYAVLSFYSNRKINGEPGRKPHVVLTIAEREFFGSKGRGGYAEIVGNAVKDGRVIDFNKKMRDDLSVIANPAGVGDITDASLTANLSHFRKEIKLFREKNHINYKLPVGEDTSPRALLANALESVAQNDMERKKLQEYKSKIDLINAEEKKLRSLTRQMQKETDPKKLRELQFEAMHTTNRINTYDRQLLRLEASKPLQDVLTREKKMAYDRGIQKGKDALEAYKKHTEEKQQEIIDRYQESRKRGVENRQKTAMRQKIRKVIRDLDKILNRGDKKKNVKEDMKDFVADALATAEVLFTDNYRNEDMVWYGVSTDMTPEETKLMSEARAIMEEISNLPTGYEGWQARQEKEEKLKSRLNYRMAKLRDVFVRERARLNKMQVSEVLGNLADSYAKLQTSEYAHIQGAYQEAVYQYLLMLKEDVGGTIVKDMSLSQLEELYKAYTMVMTTVRNANRMFAENLNNTRDTLANMVMYEVHKAGGEHGLWTKTGDKINTFSWNNEKPVYAFERIGSSTFTKLFNNIRKGQDSWAVDLQEANNFRRAIYEKYNHGTWDMDKQYNFTSASGINFELNLEQIMSLYAYSKRAQAHDHLLKGGFVFDGNTEVVVTKNGIKRTYLNKNATAYNVSFEILEGIISKLTAEQKGFVDEMQDYLSTTMGEKGNEISMELYGVKLFNEKFYFPLRSAGQYMEKAKEADLKKEQGQISIVNSGFAKATKVKASNPVVLAGFMDVWADHVNEMSMYHSFVLPMEDFRRVYNYSSPHMEGQPSASVNGVIQNAYGAAATDYIDKLYRDLNGGTLMDKETEPLLKLMNLFKKGAVFASASVVVQQPSAIARATALVDTKYFIGPKVDAKRHKALWAEVKQYAPVAVIKEMGYFDTNMGKSAVDYLTGEEYSGIKEKAIALVKDESYRDELLSKAPSLADELTWCAIWEAVKRETKDRNKNMDVRSEEFLRLAGERFSEVIDKTQVYDSILGRSANMRSKDSGMKMVTAFMAEPTTSINMVADALRKGKKGNKKYAIRAISSVVASVILNSFLVAFVQAARDDDEDESITEKYLSAFVSGIADGVNPATYIPFIKDIVSIMKGYDVERSDMAVISDLRNAYQNLGKDSVSAWRKVEGFAGSIAQIFGLPLKNIMRDLRSLYQAYDTIVNGEKTTIGGIKYAVKEALTGKSTSNMDQLYESKVAGDEAHAARVAARYEDADSADAAVREAIKNRFLEDELDFFNAQRELVLHAHMDAGDVRWLMDRWEYIKEHGSDEGYSKYNDFYEAVETGKNLKAVIKEYNDSGTDMKTLKSQITKHFKPIYMEMTTAERASIKGYLLNAYEQCGDEREYAEWMLESFVWESQGYGEVTVAAVRDYYSYCADAGVSRDVYLHIREFSNNTENDVDENGKTINYSAVKKIMAEIHSLSITNEQKTAIALTLWKESTVKKYKLW